MQLEILSGLQAVMHTAPINDWHLLYPAGALLAAAAYAKRGKMKLMYKLLLARMKKRRIGNAGILILGFLLILLMLGCVYGIFYFFAAEKFILGFLSAAAAGLLLFLMVALSDMSSKNYRSYF